MGLGLCELQRGLRTGGGSYNHNSSSDHELLQTSLTSTLWPMRLCVCVCVCVLSNTVG